MFLTIFAKLNKVDTNITTQYLDQNQKLLQHTNCFTCWPFGETK